MEINRMPNKTFRELKEWVGLNYPDNDTGRAIQAVDDVDTAAFSVETPDVLEKLNVLLSTLCQKQVINPYYIINDIWKKLSVVGLNFDMRAVTFMGDTGRVMVPVTQYGGRYGVLGDPGSYVSSDDGTRLPGGLMLSITFTKTGGIYHMEARLERGMENLPFVEETSIKEAKQYSLSHAQAFSHVPANPDRTAHNGTTNTYKEFPHSDAMHKFLSGSANHADTWKAWHDTPAGNRHKEANKKKVTENEVSEALLPKPREPNTLKMSPEQKVEAMHNHAQHKIAYWKAIMKHRASKGEDTGHALKMLRRAQDSLSIWQMHKDGKKSLGESVKKK
jgi:hypothetical protein